MDAHSEFFINKETEVVTRKTSLLFINTVKTTTTKKNLHDFKAKKQREFSPVKTGLPLLPHSCLLDVFVHLIDFLFYRNQPQLPSALEKIFKYRNF